MSRVRKKILIYFPWHKGIRAQGEMLENVVHG